MSLSFVLIGNTDAGMELSRRLVAAGYPAATDIDQADVVITYCPGLDRLEDVYFEAGGVIARASEGAYLVDLSPATPNLSKEIAAMALVNGAHPVEAPLFVCDATAENPFATPEGLGLFVAGDSEDVQAVEGLLEALAAKRVYCGEAGTAQVARCSRTVMEAVRIVGAAEAVALMRSFDPKCEQIDAVAASLPEADAKMLAACARARHAGGYTAEIVAGEVESALAAADEIGLVVPQAEAADYLFRMLVIIGGAELAASASSLLYLDEAVAAKQGLDWSRAEQMYAEMGEAHDHSHAGHNHAGHSHFDGFDEYDDFGYESGYGYSPN